NHGGGCDSDLWSHLVASSLVAGAFARAQGRNLPQLGAGIGVKGIDAAVLGCDVKHVVGAARDTGKVGQVKRLGIDFSIHRKGSEFAEGAGVDVGRGQYRLFQILPGTGDVVVIGDHVNHAWRRGRRATHGQSRRIAGGAAQSIA